MEILENCKLYKLNKIKAIYKILCIPIEAQQKNYDFDSLYTFKYLKKSKKDKKDKKEDTPKISKDERLRKYIDVKKRVVLLLEDRPIDFNSSEYRVIVNIKQEWLKKSQKKFHKLIAKELNNIPFLHSTIKHKSFSTNAYEHIGEKYVLTIDLKNFFTCITRDRLAKSLKFLLKIDSDIAAYYSKLLTSPSDKPPYNNEQYNLGQGLPSSPILAFVCNFSLFNYINDLAKSYNILMTVYVDDITFSSDEPISQHFINKLFGLFKQNGMKINETKFHLNKKNSLKKITGVNIIDGKPKIPSRKHEEIMYQYNTLQNIVEIKSFDEYLYFYNLYLKFTGNYQFLINVECKNAEGKKVIKPQYYKYRDFIIKNDKFFPRGKNKKNKNLEYTANNLPEKDKITLEKSYNELLSYVNSNKKT